MWGVLYAPTPALFQSHACCAVFRQALLRSGRSPQSQELNRHHTSQTRGIIIPYTTCIHGFQSSWGFFVFFLQLLCPFPSAYIHQQLTLFSNAKGTTTPTSPPHHPPPSLSLCAAAAAAVVSAEFVWAQEEPENMGPWSFVEPRFRKQLGIQVS